MKIKRIVLFSLILYAIGALSVLIIGFLFEEPASGADATQILYARE